MFEDVAIATYLLVGSKLVVGADLKPKLSVYVLNKAAFALNLL